MSDDTEWGPWIEHDGKGCPCRGEYVHAVFSEKDSLGIDELFDFVPHDAGIAPDSQWIWAKAITYGKALILRYRLRRPRCAAFDRLAEIVADPALPITAPEGPQRKKVTG